MIFMSVRDIATTKELYVQSIKDWIEILTCKYKKQICGIFEK